MTETDTWRFDLEVHPSGWVFPAGKSWVAGWIWLKHNRVISDLRGWIDGRPFLAIHGLPQPGRDEIFLGRQGPPYAGFTLLVEPHAGATLFRLEVRDNTGTWREFFRTSITVAEDAMVCPSPPVTVSLVGQLDSLLRHRAARPVAAWATLADETISTALGSPLNSLPNPPFHGALEEPRELGWVRYGRISVTGWLAHRTARIVRVTAMIDPLLEVALLHGLNRSDVGGHFADLPGHKTSAFLGLVDLPAGSSSPPLLKIFAELDDGSKHLVFAQRFTPRVLAGAEPPLPVLSRLTFWAAAGALLRSARRHHLSASTWKELRPALHSAWAAYAAEAPTRRLSQPAAVSPSLRLSEATQPLRVLVVTHNLNFEGAPWFIYELACRLAATPGITVRIVSPQEGPLRAIFAQAGLPVQVLDVRPALAASDAESFDTELDRVTSGLPWAETELVIGNTMVTFWAVHAARRAGKATLLYVHESTPVRRFFARSLSPAIQAVAEEAFRRTDRVVYTAMSTAQVHARLHAGGNSVLLPSWVDVSRIDAFVERTDAIALRRKHGLDPHAVLLVNIGSLCERKGQHIFLQAADLLKDELRISYPSRKVVFVMVGARPGLYLDMLEKEAARCGLGDRVVFVPETGDIFDFYRLADIFVCTSFEESFPRVLLESAAFQLPIVSTNVNGIPEMLSVDEAWLVPPGDRYQLAEAIKAALAAHFTGDRTRAERARAAVLRKYHEAHSLPQHLALIRMASPTRG